jgi:hypothetical protein
MHVFDWPEDGKLVIPGLAGTVLHAKVLGGGNVQYVIGEGEVVVDIPTDMPNKHIGVVAVEVDGRPVIYEAPSITVPADEFVSSIKVVLRVGSDDLDIRYWIDNNRHLLTYTSPIVFNETATIHAQSYDVGLPVSSIITKTVTKVIPKPATMFSTYKMYNVQRQTYVGSWDELPNFSTLTPVKEERVPSFAVPEGEFVAYVYEGYLFAPSNDMFMFALSSDDGSRFIIGSEVVVNNDGLHSTEEKRGSIALAKGWHKFTLEWFNKSGGASLDVRMGVLGSQLNSISPSSLALPE